MEEQYIGNYRILEKIGAGGMAKVYLAVHKDVPNLKVVLKVLSNPRLAERFRQEADKLALLDGHPNICRIKHFFNHGEDFVIAMEYIDGITLEQLLDQKGKLPLSEALQITSDVLSILEAAHEKGIYHRDIKPGNIMIDKAGRVKIIDFGIAKGKSDPNLTIAGTAAGTPTYMAPEQFTPDEGIDYAKVDIYATGTTLFRIVTGELPFKGDNEFALRDAKLFNEAPKPSKINPEIPKALDGIILKSLEKEPNARFDSVAEMRQTLAPLCEGKKNDTPETRIDAVKPAPPRKKTKIVPILIGVGVLVIIWFVLFKVFLSGPEEVVEEPPEPIDTTTIIEETPMSGSLVLSVIPAGDIYIDDQQIGAMLIDTSLTIDTGIHIIRVENNQAVDKIITDTVSLMPDETLPRRYSFEIPEQEPDEPDEQKPEQPAKQYGKILVGSRPRGADIYINGKLQNSQTPYTYTLETGQYIFKLMLSVEGQVQEYIDTIMVTKDGEHKVFFKP